MIGYVTLGTSDIDRSAAFYDSLLALCGAKRLMDTDGFILWGTSFDSAALSIAKPHNGEPQSVGNGVMAAIRVDSQEKVKALYAKAIELGAQDEGEPGPRGESFYAAYFRDLDGNKLNAFVMG